MPESLLGKRVHIHEGTVGTIGGKFGTVEREYPTVGIYGILVDGHGQPMAVMPEEFEVVNENREGN